MVLSSAKASGRGTAAGSPSRGTRSMPAHSKPAEVVIRETVCRTILNRGTLSDYFCTPDVRAAIARNYHLTDRVGWMHIYRPTTQ